MNIFLMDQESANDNVSLFLQKNSSWNLNVLRYNEASKSMISHFPVAAGVVEVVATVHV